MTKNLFAYGAFAIFAFGTTCTTLSFAYNEHFVTQGRTRYFAKPNPTPALDSLIEKWKALPKPSVRKALSILPPSMRMNYVLMHTSGSIQGASYQNPRAILFSPTADLVISFNGHSGQPGGNRIEAMAFNRKTEMYDFAQVTFAAGKVSTELNPQKCFSCHTSMRLPNWGTYPTWLGAFGSVQNEFKVLPQYVYKQRVSYPGGGYEPEGFSAEVVSAEYQFYLFKEFLRSQKNNPRYSLLLKPAKERYWPLSPTLPKDQNDNFDYQPARRIGIGLAFHQARTIGNKLLNTALYRDYPASLTAILLNCEPEVYPEFRDRLLTLLRTRPLFETADSILSSGKGSRPAWRHPSRMQLIAVTGILPEVWSSVYISRSNQSVDDPQSNSASFIGAFEMTTSDFMAGIVLLEQYKKSHPEFPILADGPSLGFAGEMIASLELVTELHKVIPLYSTKTIKRACVALRPSIVEENQRNLPVNFELTAGQWQEVLDTQNGKPYVLRHCAECHTAGSYPTAPFIPFDNPVALRAALLDGDRALLEEIRKRTRPDAPAEIRMPFGPSGLSPFHHDNLMEYLDGLVK